MLGGMYATIAIGLTMVMGILRIMNLAHGSLILIGCYVTYFLFNQFQIDPFLASPISFLLTFLIGLIIIRIMNPVRSRMRTSGGAGVYQILYFIGMAYCVENLLVLIMTPNPRSVFPPYGLNTLNIGGLSVTYIRLASFLFSIATLACLYIILTKTYIGRSLRALIQDEEAALMLGVNTSRLATIGFCIGCGLAGISGTLLSTIYIFNPYSDFGFLFKAICIVILAGSGRASILGTFAGSFILAIVENIGIVFAPPAYVPLLDYIILLALLLFLPRGIGGRRA